MKLPLNCTADYLADFLGKQEAQELFDLLIEKCKIDQAQLIIEAGGKIIETDGYKILFATERLIAQNTHPEYIHGKSFAWSGAMAKLKSKIENLLDKEFELAMCLYYPNGNYFAPFHSDQETSGTKTILPSLSLGEPRAFEFKDKTSGELYSLMLKSGSLLVMGEFCQSRYMHSLPKDPKYKNGRINITFREPSFK